MIISRKTSEGFINLRGLKIIYPALNAVTIFILAARTEGRNPPIIPINKAKVNELIIIEGDKANENASSENDVKFIVEIEKNCRNDARTNPITPPIIDIAKDSVRNEPKMLLLLKPNALNVPISTVRFATAEYIVIIAPIVAPKLNITVINIPKILMNVARKEDCFS